MLKCQVKSIIPACQVLKVCVSRRYRMLSVKNEMFYISKSNENRDLLLYVYKCSCNKNFFQSAINVLSVDRK